VPNVIEIEEPFCGRTDVHTDGHLRPALLGLLCRRVDLKTQPSSSEETVQAIVREGSQGGKVGKMAKHATLRPRIYPLHLVKCRKL